MSDLIAVHVTHMRADGLSDNTREDRERLLTAAERELPHGLDSANRREIEAFLANPRWGANTRCTHYTHLAEYYRWATGGDDPELSLNPMAGMRGPRRPKATPNPVSDDELDAALARSGPWWRLAVTLAAYSGERRTEICDQRREDINVDRILIRNGKGGKTAEVPTHPEIWRLVEPMPPGLLLTLPGGRHLTGGVMSSAATRHFRSIGLHGVYLHRFRHWFATMLLNQGVNIMVVKELMRHASLATTAGYLLITGEQRSNAIRTLPARRATAHQTAA